MTKPSIKQGITPLDCTALSRNNQYDQVPLSWIIHTLENVKSEDCHLGDRETDAGRNSVGRIWEMARSLSGRQGRQGGISDSLSPRYTGAYVFYVFLFRIFPFSTTRQRS